jgi:hypothetical protein
MSVNKTKILIFGNGKISKIKQKIYKSLCLIPYVVDVIEADYNQLVDLYLNDEKMNIIDISTPNGTHVNGLSLVLQYKPKANILIEKPIFSSTEEMNIFLGLTENFDGNIFINENYFYSKALKEIATFIIVNSLIINNIDIELSKNRSFDEKNGRFTDKQLGVLGIEAHHALAIINYFRINFDNFQKKVIKFDSNNLKINYHANNLDINMYFSLDGTKLFDESPEYFKDRIRMVKLSLSNNYTIWIYFDPIRSHINFSKIKIYFKNVLIEDKIIEDNHLHYSLESFIKEDFKQDNKFETSIKINKELLELSKSLL